LGADRGDAGVAAAGGTLCRPRRADVVALAGRLRRRRGRGGRRRGGARRGRGGGRWPRGGRSGRRGGGRGRRWLSGRRGGRWPGGGRRGRRGGGRGGRRRRGRRGGRGGGGRGGGRGGGCGGGCGGRRGRVRGGRGGRRGGGGRGRGRGARGRTGHACRPAVATREVPSASAPGPTGDEFLEVLRGPGVIRVLVDARRVVVDRLDAEGVVVRAERRVDGGGPLPH